MNYSKIKEINAKLKDPFKKLRFEEQQHKYWVEGDDRPIKSVSTHLKHFYDEFQTDIIAPKYAKSRGLDLDDVRNAWTGEGDIANAHGTKVHLVGEDYVRWKFFQECERPEVFDKQSLSCLEFINSLPDYLVPVATELQMYSEEHWLCGTSDLVLFNTKTKKYHIADWKTNKSLFDVNNKKPYLKVFGKKYNLRQDNLGKYNIQLNFYRFFLMEKGFNMGQSIIIHLQEDKENKKLFTTHKVVTIEEDMKDWLSTKVHLQ